jgi:hypothetical protein
MCGSLRGLVSAGLSVAAVVLNRLSLGQLLRATRLAAGIGMRVRALLLVSVSMSVIVSMIVSVHMHVLLFSVHRLLP